MLSVPADPNAPLHLARTRRAGRRAAGNPRDVEPRSSDHRGSDHRGDGAKKKTPSGPRKAPERVPAVVANFMERLRKILEARHISRRLLAEELARRAEPGTDIIGISQASVGRWFDQPEGPRLAHLALLANYLGTTIDALVDPSIPVDQLPAPGEVRDRVVLSPEDQAILRITRHMDVETAIHRLVAPRFETPTYKQVEEVIDQVLRSKSQKP